MEIKFLILLARFLGMLQRTLGRGQTHLLTAAQALGWQPGTAALVLALEKRQASLAVRHHFKRMRKLRRKATRGGRAGNLACLASVPLPSVDYSTLLLDALCVCFVVFMLGVLVGAFIGTRYGKARQQARSQRPVTTLFQPPTKPDRYYL